MFEFFMARPATLQEQVKIYKTMTILLSTEVFGLFILGGLAMNVQERRYRQLMQQHDILAKHANWEDPMLRFEMEQLFLFREIVDPPKDN